MNNNLANLVASISTAEQRIRPYVRETPLDFSHELSACCAAEVYLKLENIQYTGSFKLRGAMHYLLALSAQQREHGVVAASSGNHGAAVAYGVHALGMQGLVFVPSHASPVKVAAMQRYGADIRFAGEDSLEAELAARAYADQHNLAYISPYNDALVIAGQGTIGVELLRQQSAIDTLFIAVGGGGLLAGCAAVLKAHNPRLRIIGCQPESSAVMAHSVAAGHILDMPSHTTLSDGTAGGIEADAITFPLCREFVDEWVLVDEAQIAAAMRLIMQSHHLLIEGAAGVAVAGLLACAERMHGRKVAVVLCGANISLETLKTVLSS